MHKMFRAKAYETKHGPHFNEMHARKAVSKMENEDGSKGPHWSIEETSNLANQYGVSLNKNFNKYDWYVALNMIYSDFYRAIVAVANSNNTKYFVEFAKAWLSDKDVEEGKMWYYYIYVMSDKIREEEMECYEEEMGEDEEEYSRVSHHRMTPRRHTYEDYDDDDEDEDEEMRDRPRRRTIRYIRY